MLARLPLRQLFLAVCVVFAAPILLLAWLFHQSEQANIDFAERERDGVAYLSAVWPVMLHVAQGKPVDFGPVTQAGDQFNGSLGLWKAWRDYRMVVEGGQGSATVLDASVAFVRTIGDQSYLILDPKLESYYLMDAVVLRLPLVLQELTTLTRDAPGPGKRAAWRVDLVTQHAELARDIGHVFDAYEAAMRHSEDGGLNEALSTPLVAVRGGLASLRESLDRVVNESVSGPPKAASLRALQLARTKAIADLDYLYRATLSGLDGVLQSRSNAISTGLWTSLGIAAFVAAIALLMAALFAARITQVFTELAQRLHTLSRGDTDITIPYINYSNEIGLIARSLAIFRDHALERLRLADEIAQSHVVRERDLERVAYFDDLTGLPNRKHLYRAFGEFLRARGEKVRGAVIYLDLDRFKEINDTLGHQAGDTLIRIAAQRLQSLARPDDIVARISGDEFAILLADIDEPELLQHFGAGLLQRLAEPYDVHGSVQHLTASIGVALISPKLAHEPEELLRRADVALYRAKERGRNCCVLFDSAFDADVLYRKRIEGALREALETNAVRLAFQPQVCAQTGAITGVEALARWDDAKLGPISPGVFIPIAEHCGLIVELGRSILSQAMAHAKRWPELTIAVNISVLQLRQKGFIDMLANTALDWGVEPSRIELELTESILLEDADEVNEKLRQVNALGYRLALDDFGTGYSSLSYLTRFSFDKLKIDRSFVQSLEQSPHARTVMRSIAALGRAVGLEVCAEGVETSAQLDVVREIGCTSVQGYLFSAAVHADEVDRLVAAGGFMVDAVSASARISA